MQILYFAALRERVGLSAERISPPAHVVTIADLAHWLAGQSEGHKAAFSDLKAIRAARDQVHVTFDAPISGAAEIAFFPPVTGG